MSATLLLVTAAILHLVSGTLDINHIKYNQLYKYGVDTQNTVTALQSLSESDKQTLQQLVNLFSSPEKILSSSHYNVSDVCANQTIYLLEQASKTWAMTMLDSWAKPERGILNGNLNWIGAYDECLNVTIPASSDPTLNFSPQYCTLNTKLSLGGLTAGLHVGMCVPSGCSNTTILNIIEATLNSLHKSASTTNKTTKSYNTDKCADTDKTLDSGAVVTLVIVIQKPGCVPLREIARFPVSVNHTEDEEDTEHTPLVMNPEAGSEAKQSLAVRILLCFSLYTNGRKIISTEQPPGAITCLHGIRFLSMTWVILGHSGAFSVLLVANPRYIFTWLYRITFQAVVNATVSVDSFFVLSGLLSAYVFLKDFDKRKTTIRQFLKGLPKLYAHRYIRLTPAYAFAVLIWTCLVWYINDGPIWPKYHRTMDDRCQRHWYLNFLYVNNIFGSDDDCFGWSWYLANDMQFFIISPFVVYWIYRHFLSGSLALLAMIIGSVSSSIAVAYKQDAGLDINVLIPGARDTYDDFYYYAPWCRFHTFGVGLMVGYTVWWSKGRIRMPQIVNIVLWLVSAGLCLSVVYGVYSAESFGHASTRAERAVYNSLGRTAWSLGVGYVIIACYTNHGGPVNALLSWKGFVPLSKLTYCAYLLHPIVIWIIVRGTRYTYIYTDLTYISSFLIYFILAYMAAFPFSLLFEAPIMGLDKLLFSAPRGKK